MALTMENLKENFVKAKDANSPYVFIAVRAEGVDELIVIPERSFEAKEKFYVGAYTNNLTHVMNKNVSIRGLSYGNAREIQNII